MTTNTEAIINQKMIEQKAKVKKMVDLVLENLEFPENLSDEEKKAYIEDVRTDRTNFYAQCVKANEDCANARINGQQKQQVVPEKPKQAIVYDIIHDWARGELKQRPVREEPTQQFVRGQPKQPFIRGEPKQPFIRGEPKQPVRRELTQPVYVEQTRQFVRGKPTQQQFVRGEPTQPVQGEQKQQQFVRGEPTQPVQGEQKRQQFVRGEPTQPVQGEHTRQFVRGEPTQPVQGEQKRQQFVRGEPTQPVQGEQKRRRVSNELFAQVRNETSARFENECKVLIDAIDPGLIASIQNLVAGERSVIVHQVPLSDDVISVTVKGVVLNFSKRKFIKNMMPLLLNHYTPMFPKSKGYKLFVGVDAYNPRFIVSVGVTA